jgi:uroporphyrinogen decarboxylase
VLEAVGQIKQALDGKRTAHRICRRALHPRVVRDRGWHSNNFAKTKSLMYGHPDAWHRLCERLSGMVGDYLVAQIEAGVDVVQVFDSWVGALSAADYSEFVLPHTRRIFDIIDHRVPTIHFGTGTATLPRTATGCRRRRHRSRLAHSPGRGLDAIGHDRAVQGNLDPTLLLGPTDRLSRTPKTSCGGRTAGPATSSTSVTASCRPTPLEQVQMLAQYVHRASRGMASSRREPWMRERATDVDVVIIGGGIAGLSAAYELNARGLTARVLEAERSARRRDRHRADRRLGHRRWT